MSATSSPLHVPPSGDLRVSGNVTARVLEIAGPLLIGVRRFGDLRGYFMETFSERDLRAVGVTGREMEVLRLVGDGLANPEIAARLHLSRRTVETHVGNLLAKTGAAGRAQLRGRLTG